MPNNIDTMIIELENYSRLLLSEESGSINRELMPRIIAIIENISGLVKLNLEYDINYIKEIIRYEYAKPASFYINSQINEVKDYKRNVITEEELLSEYRNVDRNMYFNGVCSPKREYNRVTNRIELHIYLQNSTKILEAKRTGIRSTIKHELQEKIPDMIITNINSIQNHTMQIVASNLEKEAKRSQGNNKQFTLHIKGRENLYPNNELN